MLPPEGAVLEVVAPEVGIMAGARLEAVITTASLSKAGTARRSHPSHGFTRRQLAGKLHLEENNMSRRPGWFITLAIILLLWAIAGVASFAAHVFVGDKLAADQGAWDLAYHRALPAWFAWDYALATLAGLAGAVALLMRSRLAVPLYVVSLIGVVIQFGYVFLGTGLMAHKGAAATVPFPAFIALMGVVQIAVSTMAARRGWIA